jgi:hypothetical protein
LFKGAINHDSVRKRFCGFPKDAARKEVLLGDFELMSESNRVVWMKHLVRSFEENSDYLPKFCILDRNSKLPTLTMLQTNSKSRNAKSEASAGTERKRGQGMKAPVERSKPQR